MPFTPLCQPLCRPSLPLTPCSQILLLLLHLHLRSACWNTRWRTGDEAAAGASGRPGVGGQGAEEGATRTSDQRRWWWSSARCSAALRGPYGPPSPPPSSRGPGSKENDQITTVPIAAFHHESNNNIVGVGAQNINISKNMKENKAWPTKQWLPWNIDHLMELLSHCAG